MASIIRRPFVYTYKNATLVLILINTAVYLLEKMVPSLMTYLPLNVYNCLAHGMYWQPFTYMFVHGNVTHILFNMLALFFFGTSVEKAVGTKEYLLLYFLTGTLCGISSLVIYYLTGMWLVFLMGASGAVYGLLLSYAVIFPRNRIYIWGLIPVPAPVLVLAYAVIEFGSQIFGLRNGVAHSVHLAGFIFAWLYFVIRMGINPVKIWKDAYR
jgi:membrane associated rhomboid family serine protease